MHSSRTISRKTTGSVEARTAPLMKAKIQPKFKNSPNGRAPIAMIKPVPDPSIKAETKVRVATTSRNGEWGHLQLFKTAAFQ